MRKKEIKQTPPKKGFVNSYKTKDKFDIRLSRDLQIRGINDI